MLGEESRIDSGDKLAPSTLLAAGPSRWGWKPQIHKEAGRLRHAGDAAVTS